MAEKTRASMRRLLADASLEAARATVLARMADKAGRPAAARLLRAMAKAGEFQARRVLALARGKLGGLDEELQDLARRRGVEDEQRLPAWREEALAEGKAAEAALFGQLLQAARNHAAMLVEPDKAEGALHVCQICGYVALEAPEHCPICQAVPERFEKVE